MKEKDLDMFNGVSIHSTIDEIKLAFLKASAHANKKQQAVLDEEYDRIWEAKQKYSTPPPLPSETIEAPQVTQAVQSFPNYNNPKITLKEISWAISKGICDYDKALTKWFKNKLK